MNPKILLVDDEADLLVYLKTFLQDQGYEVLCAQDAQTALQIIRQEPPSLICLDIMMPVQSGVSFYEHLRRQEGAQEIPVIIISGLTEEALKPAVETLKSSGKFGASLRFLNKPVDLVLLLNVIRQVLPQ